MFAQSNLRDEVTSSIKSTLVSKCYKDGESSKLSVPVCTGEPGSGNRRRDTNQQNVHIILSVTAKDLCLLSRSLMSPANIHEKVTK